MLPYLLRGVGTHKRSPDLTLGWRPRIAGAGPSKSRLGDRRPDVPALSQQETGVSSCFLCLLFSLAPVDGKAPCTLRRPSALLGPFIQTPILYGNSPRHPRLTLSQIPRALEAHPWAYLILDVSPALTFIHAHLGDGPGLLTHDLLGRVFCTQVTNMLGAVTC